MLTLVLALLYPIAVQYDRQYWPAWVTRLTGWVRFPFVLQMLCTVVAFFALLIDVAANYTELALLSWDRPQRKEYTFSTRLLRLKHDRGWRGYYAAYVIVYLNFFAPDGRHV